MDVHTRYPESFCLWTKKPAEVAEKINELKCRYSTIEEIISEQDEVFNISLKDELRKGFSVRCIKISTYDDETTGMLDKLNLAMETMVNKAQIDGDAANWHKHIHSVCYTHRMAKHPDTKSSPLFLLFNQRPVYSNVYSNDINLTTQDDIEMTNNENEDEFTSTDLCEQISENVSNDVDFVEELQDSSYCVYKKEFNVGEKVLLKNSARQNGSYKINLTTYKGPYIVTKYIGRGNYQLKHVHNNKIMGLRNQRDFERYSEELQEEDTKNPENESAVNNLNLLSQVLHEAPVIAGTNVTVSSTPVLFEGSYSAGVSIECSPKEMITDQSTDFKCE